MIITIDGVAASGKSSVASGVAHALNMPYVSSGLLYRAATYAALSAALDPSDAPSILSALSAKPIELKPLSAGNEVWRGGRDITTDLHTAAIDEGVSIVAQHPALREWVNARLRALPAPFVAEGRDMGTAVFPQAQHKFFLSASARVRAQRRVAERIQDLDAVEAALIERDKRDHNNLTPAPDALQLDTSDLSLQAVIDTVLQAIRQGQ